MSYKGYNMEDAIILNKPVIRLKFGEWYGDYGDGSCLNVEKETIWMLTDIIGINQIFMNVIVNAIDAVEEKGKIDITLFEKNDLVNFIVKDNGCGIPKGKEERLFDPFFTTKVVGSGIGLGLYIVKREVDKLNGRINLSKNNNKGTLFTITIPKL